MILYHRKSLFVKFLISTFLLIFLAFVFFKESNKNYIVEIHNGEFNPSELRILPGSEVVFKNIDIEPHWVASDNHPTHELYPEFDSKRPILPGKSWSVVLKNSGTWSYHDHLNSKLQGIVYVGGKDFVEGSSKNKVLEEVKKVKEEKGSSAAWLFLKNSYSSSGIDGGHDIAHFIGGFLYEEKGLKALVECDSSFVFGCFHGILEKFIEKEGIDKLSQAVVECRSLPVNKGQGSCYHGIGHGVMTFYKISLDPALAECDKVFSDINEREYCYNGVFMENGLTLAGQTDDPFWPCNNIKNGYKAICYLHQEKFLFSFFGDDVNKITQACLLAGQNNLVQNCLQGVGHRIARTNLSEPDRVVNSCSLAGGESVYRCQIAAAEEYIFQNISYETTLEKLCLTLPDKWAKLCEERIKARIN